MKTCSKCKQEFPATSEYFNKDKSKKSGFRPDCIYCIAHYTKKTKKQRNQYLMDNAKKIKKQRKQYYIDNVEKEKERSKQYYIDNTEKIKQYYKQFYVDNVEKIKTYQKDNVKKIKQYHRQYYKNNAEIYKKQRKENSEINKQYSRQYKKKNAEKIKQWWKNNTEKTRGYCQNRRALKKQLPCTLTIKQWDKIKLYFHNYCSYCGKERKLEQDHFIPLSKGGGYTKENIIPACRSCNSSKNNTYFYLWYPTYQHYSKEREQKIYDYLESVKGTKQLALI